MDPIIRLNAALEGRYRIEREGREFDAATFFEARQQQDDRLVVVVDVKAEREEALRHNESRADGGAP